MLRNLVLKKKSDTSLPTWALILILLAVAIVLGAFCCFLLCTEKGRKIGECIISCGELCRAINQFNHPGKRHEHHYRNI